MSDYRQGYTDARDLITSLGTDVPSIRLARHACPPAMPKEYRDGFIKACEDAIQRLRPNKNYILSVMRDGDMADPWGTAMAWGFACAENLAAIGADVPSELEYRMSIAGPCIESYEDFEVAEFLGLVRPATEEETQDWLSGHACAGGYETDHGLFIVDTDRDVDDSKVAEVTFAARCLHRYIDWCRQAGKDY